MHSETVSARNQFTKKIVDLFTAFSEEQHVKFESTTSALGQANENAANVLKKSVKQLDAGYKKVLLDRSRMNEFVECGLEDAEQRKSDNFEVSDIQVLSLLFIFRAGN